LAVYAALEIPPRGIRIENSAKGIIGIILGYMG
jgi:hypothetical protein